jgi:hypothetical protein
MVLTAYSVLFPVTGLSCHRHQRDCASDITGVMRWHRRSCDARHQHLRALPKQRHRLDASVGASEPHGFTVCERHHSSLDAVASIASCAQRP